MMSSKTKSLPKKKARFAFICESEKCDSSFMSESLLRIHTLEKHSDLNTACKCGAGFINKEHLNQHRQRCPLRYGRSSNKMKKAVMENLANEKDLNTACKCGVDFVNEQLDEHRQR